MASSSLATKMSKISGCQLLHSVLTKPKILRLRHYKFFSKLTSIGIKEKLFIRITRQQFKLVYSLFLTTIPSKEAILHLNVQRLSKFVTKLRICDSPSNSKIQKDLIYIVKTLSKIRFASFSGVPYPLLRYLRTLEILSLQNLAIQSGSDQYTTNLLPSLKTLIIKDTSFQENVCDFLEKFWQNITRHNKNPIEVELFAPTNITILLPKISFWHRITIFDTTVDTNTSNELIHCIVHRLTSIRELAVQFKDVMYREIVSQLNHYRFLEKLEIRLERCSSEDLKLFIMQCTLPMTLSSLSLRLPSYFFDFIIIQEQEQQEGHKGENTVNMWRERGILSHFKSLTNLEELKLSVSLSDNFLQHAVSFITLLVESQSKLKRVCLTIDQAETKDLIHSKRNTIVDLTKIFTALTRSKSTLQFFSMSAPVQSFHYQGEDLRTWHFPRLETLSVGMSRMPENFKAVDIVNYVDMPIVHTLTFPMIMLINVPYCLKFIKKIGEMKTLRTLQFSFSVGIIDGEDLDEIVTALCKLKNVRRMKIMINPFSVKLQEVKKIFETKLYQLKQFEHYSFSLGDKFVVLNVGEKMQIC